MTHELTNIITLWNTIRLKTVMDALQ